MLVSLGYQKDRDWFVHTLAPGENLSEPIRRHNLITLGGPVLNSLTQELCGDHPMLHIEYVNSDDREFRLFHWRNRTFRWTDTVDYAVIAVKPNPFNPKRRLTIIFGLTGIGTMGGGRFFASNGDEGVLKHLRKQIEQTFSSKDGNLEVLVRVQHDQQRTQIQNTALVAESDGLKMNGHTSRPVSLHMRALQQLYTSLQRNPRPLIVSELKVEITITKTFGVRIVEEATWEAASEDIVVRGKEFRDTVPVERLEDIGFEAKIINGVGEIVVLPAENSVTTKRFLLFPIPPVKPGHPAPVVRTSVEWPRSVQNLEWTGREDEIGMQITPHAVQPVQDVEVTIAFETSPAARFHIIEKFPPPPGHVRQAWYDVTRPYTLKLSQQPPGTQFLFTVERIS